MRRPRGRTTQRVLSFIRDYWAERGYPPTVREIQVGCGLSSTSVAAYHLRVLERQGQLRREPETSRGLQLRDRPFAAASVPLLGTIAAGEPIPVPHAEAWRERAEMIEVPAFMARSDRVFALRVRGESMIDALIADGDLVLLEATATAEPGQMVAVWLKTRQETTLKRFYPEGARVRLQPENSQMEPLLVPASEVEIQGRVVGVLRYLR